MNTIAISYSGIQSASKDAKTVSKKLGAYADSLYSNVYTKLSNYSGLYTDNISTAQQEVNQKISDLRAKQARYDKLSAELDGVKAKCISTDKAVRKEVASLSYQFMCQNEINIGLVENVLGHLFVSVKNGTSAGRWIGDKGQEKIDKGKNLCEMIREWYDCDGGEEYLKGVVSELANIALELLGVGIAIASGAGFVALFFAAVGAGIAIGNSIVAIANESKALALYDYDPATARRYSREDSLQDTIRTESDSAEMHKLANVIDITKLTCDAVGVLSDVSDFMKNGYKWATGDLISNSDVNLNKMFSKEARKAYITKFDDITRSLKLNNIKSSIGKVDLRDVAKGIKSDLYKNLKKEYFPIFNVEGKSSKLDIMKFEKKWIKVGKNIIDEDYTSLVSDVGLSAFSNKVYKPFLQHSNIGDNNKITTDSVSLKDIHNIASGVVGGIRDINSLGKGSPINEDVLKKLSQFSNKKYSISDNYVPKVSFSL